MQYLQKRFSYLPKLCTFRYSLRDLFPLHKLNVSLFLALNLVTLQAEQETWIHLGSTCGS